MAALLLGSYVRLLNWVIRRLQSVVEFPEDYVLSEELVGIQKLYLDGKDTLEIAERYPHIHPELVHLLVEKLTNQNGCLDYMDRMFSKLMS